MLEWENGLKEAKLALRNKAIKSNQKDTIIEQVEDEQEEDDDDVEDDDESDTSSIVVPENLKKRKVPNESGNQNKLIATKKMKSNH